MVFYGVALPRGPKTLFTAKVAKGAKGGPLEKLLAFLEFFAVKCFKA
jgi:hypothetical protein